MSKLLGKKDGYGTLKAYAAGVGATGGDTVVRRVS